MLDVAAKWGEVPDWSVSKIGATDLGIASIPNLDQMLVSGDLATFCREYKVAAPVGLMGQTSGSHYAVRLARDRMLVVGSGDKKTEFGWHPQGYAVSSVSSALHVFEISGAARFDLFSRCTAADLGQPSPVAALQFAGATAYLYNHGPDASRLHIDRGLGPWAWIMLGKLLSAKETELQKSLVQSRPY